MEQTQVMMLSDRGFHMPAEGCRGTVGHRGKLVVSGRVEVGCTSCDFCRQNALPCHCSALPLQHPTLRGWR